MEKTTGATHLFDLIRSLSKTEKRYFKIFSSRHTIGDENNYMLLFDFIGNMDEYEENLIFKTFKKESFLNNFSITKKRLYDSILRALDSFYTSSSIEAQLHKMLHSAEILYKKALYNQCKRLLISAEKLAVKQEKYHVLLEIRLKFKRLIENESYTEVTSEEINNILQDDLKYIQIIQNYSQLWNVKSNLFSRLNKKGIARSTEDHQAYTEIIEPLNSISTICDFDSNYLKHHTLSAYYFAIDNTELSLQEIHENISLFQDNPDKIEAEPNVYFSTLTNAIYSHHSKRDYHKAHEFLSILKSLPQQLKSITNEDLDIKLFSSINSIELNLLNVKGDFSAAIHLEPIIEEGYRLYGKKISRIRKAYLNFSLAVAFFGVEDYNLSLKWINSILNDAELDQKEDIFCFAQLFNLIIHFELNHNQLLPYALKSTQRYLKTRNRVYAFESIFLKYVNKIVKSPSELDKIDFLADVADELNELRDNPFEKVVFDYFDFATWAKAKVNGISFSVSVKDHLLVRSK